MVLGLLIAFNEMLVANKVLEAFVQRASLTFIDLLNLLYLLLELFNVGLHVCI